MGVWNGVNELEEKVFGGEIIVEDMNVGGGLGIDYRERKGEGIGEFGEYFGS